MPTEPRSHDPLDLDRLLSLYDERRYLDAYRASRGAWGRPELIAKLPAEALVHAARLAGRLGGHARRRWLLGHARRRAPTSPIVRYFTGSGHVLASLARLEREPELGSGDPRWEASYCAQGALAWAQVRDFPRAHLGLARAKAHEAEAGWVACCEAEVLLREDRWDEAHVVAERAWALVPGLAAAASVLGRALAKVGRLEEVAERILAVAEHGQCCETLSLGQWYLCALAERSSPADRVQLARRALALADRLPALAPLADRITCSTFARRRADAAMLLGESAELERSARQVRSPFFREVAARLAERRPGRPIQVRFSPVFQRRNTCLPASVAAVTSAFGREIDHDAMAAALTYEGTAAWRAVDWLAQRGFVVRPFIADPGAARALLEAGLPFVLGVDWIDQSHATAAVGLDDASGVLVIHDPSLERWTRVLHDRLDEGEAPFGPEALAIVPAERVSELERALPASSPFHAALLAHRKAAETLGASAAEGVVAELEAAEPGHPCTRRLRALQLQLVGRPHEAIQLQEALLAEYPSSPHLRRELLHSLHRTNDTAHIHRTLEDIVERRRAPGIRADDDPPLSCVTFVAQYADQLGVTRDGFPRAERLLWDALGQAPWHGEAHHMLADVYARQDRHEESVLPYRVASLLCEENDHYARAAADALRRLGREPEAVAFLRDRVARQGKRAMGGLAWIALVEALEDYGRPDEAIASMSEAQAARPEDATLGASATRFWVRMGRWDLAERALLAVEASGSRPGFLEAATMFHESAGHWALALELAETWMAEVPGALDARRAVLRLVLPRDGVAGALALARRWMKLSPDDETFEDLYRGELQAQGRLEDVVLLMRLRTARNPRDGWAWRELGHQLADRAARLPVTARAAVIEELEPVVARCVELCPEVPPTRALAARLLELRGDRSGAIEGLASLLERAPDYGFAYERAWALAQGAPREELERLLARLEACLLRVVGPLYGARSLALSIAERFGAQAAEAAVLRWRAAVPDHPELVEALADLWLEHGQGRTDAQRAAELLEPAVRRYPNHFALRLSLAHAYAVLQRQDEQLETLRELLRRRPLHASTRRNLGVLLAQRGDLAAAEALLIEGTRLDPLEVGTFEKLATLCSEGGRQGEALAWLREGLAKSPTYQALRATLVERLQDAELHDEAVRAAQEGTAIDPDQPLAWTLLGDCQQRAGAGVAEVERAHRRALELDGRCFASADSLAMLLAGQRRFDEAQVLMDQQAATLADPSPALGRRAWLLREAGKLEGAIDAMARVLEAFPAYRWGWQRLMDWLLDDQRWELARSLLEHLPPAVRLDPELGSRRLIVLAAAGVPEEGLDPEWAQLLRDFPEHENLHVRRFDMLWERATDEGRHQATAVLEAIHRTRPLAPYVLARRVLHLAWNGEDAVEAALALWQLPGDDGWPEETAFEGMTGQARQVAVRAVLDLLRAGQRVRRRAIELVVQNVGLTVVRPLWRRIGPRRWRDRPLVRPLVELLDTLTRLGTEDGSISAVVLDQLDEVGASRAALAFWRKNPERCHRLTPIWQKIGYFLVTHGDASAQARARTWLADWRERAGVQMWAVANYATVLRRLPGLREDLGALLMTCRDALARLPHDHSARYLASLLCECLLRTGGDLCAEAAIHRALVEDSRRGYWLPPFAVRLPDLIVPFFRIDEAVAGPPVGRGRRLLALTHELANGVRQVPPWARRAWLQRLGPHLTVMDRLRARWILSPLRLRA